MLGHGFMTVILSFCQAIFYIFIIYIYTQYIITYLHLLNMTYNCAL